MIHYFFILLQLSITESKLEITLEPARKLILKSEEMPLSNIINVINKKTIYIGNISLGTPSISLRFMFDTGSSVISNQWIWVSSKDCESCHHASPYSQETSSSYESQNKSLTISYDNHVNVMGTLSKETFSVAHKKLKGQHFILASQNNGFKDMPAEGMIGLAFPELCLERDTFIQTMMTAEVIKEPTFSLYFGNNNYGRKKEKFPSTIIFGGHDLEKYSDEKMSLLRVVYTGHWSVTLSKIHVGGDLIKSSTRLAIIDSGVNILTGPPADVLNMFSKIQESKSCILSELLVCECDDFDDFPAIQFFLDGKSFSINPDEYLYKDKSTCIVLITNNRYGVWILGNPFLRSYYSYFDMNKKVIGLARSSSASKLRKNSSSFWTVVFIILGLIAALIIVLLARIYYLKRRRTARVNPNREENLIPLQDLRK